MGIVEQTLTSDLISNFSQHFSAFLNADSSVEKLAEKEISEMDVNYLSSMYICLAFSTLPTLA